MTKISSLLVAAALSALAPIAALAQQGPVVKSIEVQYAGPESVSRERILANMRTAVGKPYSEVMAEDDIRSIYGTGAVNNVRIFGEPSGDGGVKVFVVVQPKPTVGSIDVYGAERISEKRIRREISAKVGDPLNESNLEADRQKIISLYREKNFADADVDVKTDTDEKAGRATVTITVTEGVKSLVKGIRFEGNTSLSAKQIRKVMKTRPQNWTSILTKDGRLESAQLEEDVLAIRGLYQDQGFSEVRVDPAEIVPREKSGVDVVIRIVEGAKFSVRNVAVRGAAVFTTDEVVQVLKTSAGGVYSPKQVGEDARRISDLYGARGYVDLRVATEASPAGSGVVDIAFDLEEGQQSYVERINISGNTRTKDKVIRRELAVAPGDIYNTVLVDASRDRLKNLNYFERVEAFPADTLIAGRKDLNISLEEKRTGSFNFGLGFSSIDNLIGFAEVQQSNFDITNPWAFTGGGQRFRARLQLGLERRDVIVSLTEPYFLDYKFSLGGELYYRDASYISDVYSESSVGGALIGRKPLGKFGSVRMEYRLEQVGINDVDEDASQEIKDEEGNTLSSKVTLGYTFDSRDSVFLTRKGERVDLSTYVAGGVLGGGNDVYGFDIEASKYFLLAWDTILTLNGQIGTVSSWAGGDKVPIFERLFLGGANNLRGFNYRDVGPKDEDDEPIGGQTLARMTVEYTFPIMERLRGAVFYDAGFVNRGSYDFSPSDFNSDVGIGVRIDLPIGPVRLDYGIPMQADDSNGGGGKFNFNVGYQF
jgi:outer membrane protein insertion porin family